MPVAGEITDRPAGEFPTRSAGSVHDGSNDGRAASLQPDGGASSAAAALSGETGPTLRNGKSMEQRIEALMPRQPRANPLPASPVAAAAPPADEIQIHIGRIEITAVAPAPAQRPAVRPNPRGVSLDEYLRHGNERAP
jgi:hypothetical protein